MYEREIGRERERETVCKRDKESVCACMCVFETERETERESEREKDRAQQGARAREDGRASVGWNSGKLIRGHVYLTSIRTSKRDSGTCQIG